MFEVKRLWIRVHPQSRVITQVIATSKVRPGGINLRRIEFFYKSGVQFPVMLRIRVVMHYDCFQPVSTWRPIDGIHTRSRYKSPSNFAQSLLAAEPVIVQCREVAVLDETAPILVRE